MKAQERHRLKTNELAQQLAALPVWIKGNGRTLVLFGGLAVLAVVVVLVWWRVAAAAQEQNSAEFSRLLGRTNVLQHEAVNAARMVVEPTEQEQESMTPVRTYDPSELAGAMGRLADQSSGHMEALALLEEAELVRSRLYFSHEPLTQETRQEALARADSLYERVAQMEQVSPALMGRALMGRALVAEDRGAWDDARQIYETLAAANGPAGGTAFPSLAARRLAMLSELSEPIQLPEGSNIPQEEPEVAQTLAAPEGDGQAQQPEEPVATEPMAEQSGEPATEEGEQPAPEE